MLDKKVNIKLQGQVYTLIFNANTMAAFEDATGLFYMDVISDLFGVVMPKVEEQKKIREQLKHEQENPLLAGIAEAAIKAGVPAEQLRMGLSAFEVVRKVPIKTLRALIWAAYHEYRNDEPVWPLTIHQVGRLIEFTDIPAIFTTFLQGQLRNNPTKIEMGESPAQSGTPVQTTQTGVAPNGATAGGERSIELPADVLG